MQQIIIAAGPVIVEDNKVLLNDHGETDFWKFCGGKVDHTDISLVDAAKREVKEEMGIDIEVLDDAPFLYYTRQDDKDVILVHYLAKRIEDIFPDKEIRDWKWFDLGDLPENLAPNIIPALKYFKFIK